MRCYSQAKKWRRLERAGLSAKVPESLNRAFSLALALAKEQTVFVRE